jgi:hypothetical protein
MEPLPGPSLGRSMNGVAAPGRGCTAGSWWHSCGGIWERCRTNRTRSPPGLCDQRRDDHPQPDDAQPAMVEDGAPLRSLFLDREGRLGVGTTVRGRAASEEAIQLSNWRYDNRWRCVHSSRFGKRDGSLALFDKAGQARWLVDSEGRIGINTTKLVPPDRRWLHRGNQGFLVERQAGGRFRVRPGRRQPTAPTESGSNSASAPGRSVGLIRF